MKKIRTVFICAGMLLTFKSYSQNIPLGTLPMLYNGGFAGEAQRGRFNAGASVYEWAKYDVGNNVYRSYFVSYDQFIKKLSTGVGITAIDNATIFGDNFQNITGLETQRGTFVVASISPKISFKGKYTLAPFVNVIYSDSRYTHGYLNFNFAPQVPDSIVQSFYNSLKTRYSITERFGFLINSKKSYFGVSFNMLNDDTHPYTNDVYVYPDHKLGTYPADGAGYQYGYHSKGASWTFQAGRTFQKLPESKFSITTQFAWQYTRYTYHSADGYSAPWLSGPITKTKSSNRIDVNLTLRYGKFIAAINNNGLGLGFQNKNLKVMLSQNRIFFDKEEKQATISARYLLKSTSR